ncbi:MAG: MerR family transcriptional regulator [Eubacteriales bacterium]|nr:MerR family transcriptional regulator [Eubacteriales bacterium]
MKTYTIKEVSKMFNLPASTLRYYEDMGILTNVGRTESGQRIYTDGHINRLRTICCFKGTGMSIAKLQTFFSYEEKETGCVDAILDLLNEQKAEVTAQIEKMQKDLKHVERKLHYYSDIKTAQEAGTPLPDWADYRDKEF